MIDIKEYDKKIELAFYESGGGIVKRNYDDSVRGLKTLEDIVLDLVHDIKLEPEEHEQMIHYDMPLNDKDRIIFIEAFIGEKCGHPELCGAVAGILFREGKLEEVLKFLEVDDMDEPRYWDS